MTMRNVDFQGGTSIPFTQYLRPNGRQVAQWIDEGPDGIDAHVVAKARLIVAAGFFLEMEELETVPRRVNFSIGDDHGDYASKTCVNGPDVPGVVRKMILDADIDDLEMQRDIACGDAGAA